MTPRQAVQAVRLATAAVCIIGIPGMIVTTVLKHTGAVIAFGVSTSVAILCLIAATAASGS